MSAQFPGPANSILVDKCQYDEAAALSLRKALGEHWGYGYADLLTDLATWSTSPYVTIDSLGASVQQRALWQLTITAGTHFVTGPSTVFIHARTHPAEVQGWWVTREIIENLLSERPLARMLRAACVFYIIPMHNPDGVELELARTNANGIDIEGNWFSERSEPEVAVLRARFFAAMNSESPIEIALNMHSAFACRRYFVYHDPIGTSAVHGNHERAFVEDTRSFFPGGIEPWDYFVGWSEGTPLLYPESWFWVHYGEDVLALTYEDMNCVTAGDYDSTATAILNGIADDFGLDNLTGVENRPTSLCTSVLRQNYPNPFNSATTIEFDLPESGNVNLDLFDLSGQKVLSLIADKLPPGGHRVSLVADRLASGVYLCVLKVILESRERLVETKKLMLLK